MVMLMTLLCWVSQAQPTALLCDMKRCDKRDKTACHGVMNGTATYIPAQAVLLGDYGVYRGLGILLTFLYMLYM